MSDMEHHAKPQPSDDQIEGQSTQGSAFEEFYGDFESIESLGVTNQELQALSRASLLGIPNSREDVIFILRQIRESMKSMEAQASDPLGSIDTPAKRSKSRCVTLARSPKLFGARRWRTWTIGT